MNSVRRYQMWKAATNVVSGFSMITLIVLGVLYIKFDNAFVFTDTHISVTNNPVTAEKDIEFYMVGSKKYECNSTAAYGTAHAVDGSHSHNLDTFTKRYVQNTAPGAAVENGWHMKVPEDMKDGGEYRISMTGEFECVHSIFKSAKSQTFDNIYLKVDPR